MRTLVGVTVVTITSAVLAYSFMGENTATEPLRAVTAAPGSTSAVEVRGNVDELTSALRALEQTNQEQLQQEKLRQTRLNKMLADLDARLRSVETGASGHVARAVASDRAERGTDTAVPDSGGGPAESAGNSEADFVGSLDETLRVGFLDRDAADLAMAQAGTGVAKLPGTRLEAMQCGERFCRATFAQDSGKPSAILDLFGEPPFVTEGFTIDQPDGRVQLYFARPGESLEKLRKEAQNAAG